MRNAVYVDEDEGFNGWKRMFTVRSNVEDEMDEGNSWSVVAEERDGEEHFMVCDGSVYG